MLIIPAIDIKGGRCVRLLQGDPEHETVYSDDPVSVAQRFEALGARLIHVVDLDGAFAGYPVNSDLVTAIAQSVDIAVEIGGGIRTRESIDRYRGAGINRIILGTAALGDGFQDLIRGYTDAIVIGVDAKNGMVATHGWKEISSVRAAVLIREMQEMGIDEIIYTDIATDGMLTGPNVSAVREILSQVQGLSLIASGGIAATDDLYRLSELVPDGLKGCIIGKAVYDGRIDLAEVFRVFG
jgi:phosphoribosylformimino-5-aminoimidazole carboxamide ribotide isomerase